MILSEGDTARIEEEWLDLGEDVASSNSIGLSSSLVSRERELIEAALQKSMGRVAGPNGAADLLGIPRTTLESRIKSLQIDKFQYKSSGDCRLLRHTFSMGTGSVSELCPDSARIDVAAAR